MDNDVRMGHGKAISSAGFLRARSTGTARGRRARRLAGSAVASTLVAGLAAAAGGNALASASVRPAQVDHLVAIQAAPRLLPLGAHAIGAVRATEEISGGLALKPRSQAAITQFISDVTNSHSLLYHHYLAKGQYAARFGPTKATIAAVRNELRNEGLKVTGVSSNGLLVGFRGTASRVEAAFHTGLERVSLAKGGIGQATTSSVRLPSSIAHNVQAVLGLDNLVHETNTLEHVKGTGHAVPGARAPHTSNGGPVACADAQGPETTGATTDQQLASAYGLDGLYSAHDLGSGQTVDIYELEPFFSSDIASFDSCYFPSGHAGTVTVTPVDGGPGTGEGSGEAALDVEDVSAIAPSANIDVFSGPNMDNAFGPLDTWNEIAIADNASEISSSWGVCEAGLQTGAPGDQEAENNIFEQTAAQGQSVFSAAGDDGSDSCASHDATAVSPDLSVLDPASQPYVVSVGGTTFLTSNDPPDETVWNNGNNGGGGGGGISETWAMPSWQAGSITDQSTSATQACSNDPTGTADNYHLAGQETTLPAGTLCREMPDVSALADPQSGITIFFAGVGGDGWTQIGGTSSSTPLWAAMTAEMNASSECGADTLGFVSPLLYAVGDGTHYSSAFNDITVGNNDNLGVGDGTTYPAGTGYDLASGLGTPRITNSDSEGLVNQLCGLVTSGATPAVTGIAPSVGPIGGSGTAVISGSNFGGSQGAVFFGDVAATVTGWTSTAVTVDVPAYTSPAGSFAGEGGSDVVTVTTPSSPGPEESSSPGSASVFHYTGGTLVSPKPIVDYVSTVDGPAAGGNIVHIVGSGFDEGSGVTGVTFGDVAGTSETTLSDDELTVTVPSDATATCANDTPGVCQVQVVVSNGNGASATSTIYPAYEGAITFGADGAFVPPAGCGCEVIQAPTEYDYAPVPTVTSVSPGYASETGGTPITITGTGFNLLDLYWVNVGVPPGGFTNYVEDFNVLSITPTQIVESALGDDNISAITVEPDPSTLSVVTGGGTATAPSFSFAGVPTVSGLSTHIGSQPDPAPLTITGHGFDDADQIVFIGQGDTDFVYSTTSNFTINSDTSITVTPPQFFDIPTDVLVCSVTGCSAPNPKHDAYDYVEPGRPIVDSSSPSSGPEHGGTLVTIKAQLDDNLVSVHFGSLSATIVSAPFFSPSGPIEVVAPPSTKAQKVNITITTITLSGNPTSATTSAATFTYKKSSPSAPQDLKVTAGKDSASASWKAPVTTGGDKITGYVVTATSKNEKTVSATTTKLSATLTGLVAHKDYVVTVVAKSALGKGLPATANVTPT